MVPLCSKSTWPTTKDLRFPLDWAACSGGDGPPFYLASDAGRDVTGMTLMADGGLDYLR